jgi:diguanylate cyclase (GGDEF)-like protein
MNLWREELKAAALPAAILLLAGMAAFASQRYSTSLGNFGVFGPYAVLVIGGAMAFWFNRGRAFIALVSLLIAFIAYRVALGFGQDDFALRAVLTTAGVFVPLNLLLVLLLRERGVAYFRNYRWILLGLVEILLMAWIATAGRSPLSGTAWHAALEHWLLRPAPAPMLGRLLIAVAFGVAILRAWPKCKPLDIAMIGALIALFIAGEWSAASVTYGVFFFAAGVIILLAILQESHRMAFVDELTGLPGRRALDESLPALGPVYSIAMVDVDHFKKFNDTHGHDTGDQVLKLVGAKLAELDRSGKAFRYGGEEFAVLFPDIGIADALPRLEILRKDIEDYRMAMRTAAQRRGEARASNDRRRQSQSLIALQNPAAPPLRTQRLEQLSVTVSIGVAERTEVLDSTQSVIRSADQALYRAKEGGRNRVSV